MAKSAPPTRATSTSSSPTRPTSLPPSGTSALGTPATRSGPLGASCDWVIGSLPSVSTQKAASARSLSYQICAAVTGCLITQRHRDTENLFGSAAVRPCVKSSFRANDASLRCFLIQPMLISGRLSQPREAKAANFPRQALRRPCPEFAANHVEARREQKAEQRHADHAEEHGDAERLAHF